MKTTSEQLRRLADTIGEQRLGPELSKAVSSGAAVNDGSGYFRALATQILAVPKK